ncbi:hypothetical protein LUW74_07645 [Actinomadura madurae]|uniref:hypothetical protein n=1 Tax=Actinomadura madurae TaxID=1993 RepID=UPI002025E79C|nr:hypothetical protein [Actinomadura madurae]URN03230.1 hypothetical protein LUW74_07645 [Actinomadura madurae]
MTRKTRGACEPGPHGYCVERSRPRSVFPRARPGGKRRAGGAGPAAVAEVPGTDHHGGPALTSIVTGGGTYATRGQVPDPSEVG